MAEAKIDIILSNGAKAGNTLKELGKDANRLNKEIKDLKPGSQEFINKSKDLQQVSGRIKDVKDQIRGTAQASDSLKDAFSQFIPFSGTFQQVGQSFGIAQKGVGGLTSSMGALRAAIIATGVGALVVGLMALVTWMKKTDEGADFLEDAMNGVTSHFEVLTSRLNNLKDSFNDLLKNPVKFFKEIVTDTRQAVIENQKYIDSLRELEDRQHGIDIAAAENEKTVTRLLLQSKNVSLTYQERLDLLDQATKKESELFVKQQQVREEMFAAEQRNLAERIKQQNKYVDLESYTQGEIVRMVLDGSLKKGSITNEEIERFKQAQIAKINGETEFINFQEKIENRRAQLTEKQTAENEKAAAEAQKRRDADAKAEADKLKKQEEERKQYLANLRNLEDMNLQAMANGREKDLANLELSLNRQLESIEKNTPFYAERVAAAQELARQKRDEVNKKWDEKDLQDLITQSELELSTELNLLNERFLQQEFSNSEYVAKTEELALAYQERKMAAIRAAHGEESKEYQKAKEEYLNLQQASSDRALAIKKQELADQQAAMEGSLGTFGNFFGVLAGMQKQGTEQWKSFALTQASISTIQSALNAYQSTAAIPIVGPALAPIAAAAALAAGYQRVREIQKTKVEAPVSKKEKGGLLRGKRHSQGGIPIEAEDGEFIFSRKAVQGIGVDELSRVNNYFTRKMEIGGPVNPFQDRASIASSSATSAASSPFTINNDALIEEVRGLRSELANWPRVLKVQNVVTETEDALKTVNTIRDSANV